MAITLYFKMELWSKESWEDILARKKKYFDFCNFIGFKINLPEYNYTIDDDKNSEISDQSQKNENQGNFSPKNSMDASETSNHNLMANTEM